MGSTLADWTLLLIYSQYLELLQHSHPALSVLEVAVESEEDDSTLTTSSLLLQQSNLAGLAKIWDVSTAYRNETVSKTGTGSEGSLKILDFGEDLPADTTENHYDLLIASSLGLSSYASNPAEAVSRMCKVVKQGGLMGILTADSMLSSIQPVLDASNLETIVLHRAEMGASLVIAKKSHGSRIERMANGTTNGMAEEEQTQITLIQAANPTEAAVAVASGLIASLEKHGYETCTFSWGLKDISTLADKSCISLLEFQRPLLRDLGSEDFESVKKLLLETKNLFWVTALDDPGAAMIDGLVRVVRNETPGLNMRIFHADEPSAPAERLAKMISKAFLWTGEDNEFSVKDGFVHTCRVEEDAVLNEEINGLLPGASKTVASLPLGQVQYPVKLGVRTPGMLSSVCLEPDESAEEELEPDFVEIKTKATALK